MGGKNPYIGPVEAPLPEKSYKIDFKSNGKSVLVDPKSIPFGDTGLPGSILDIAMSHGIDIDHACGGVVACSTCHVFVTKGGSTCNPPSDAELDQLDNAPGSNLQSRLACQCVPNGKEDIEIQIPGWNRNLAREGR